MKTNIFLLVFSILILLSCNESNSPSPEFNCPLWYDPYSVGFNPPIPTHIIHDISTDGKKLAFSSGDIDLQILYLNSGYVEKINLQNLLPYNVIFFGISNAIWCPYHNDKILLHVATYTDTINNKGYVYGQNIYLLSLKDFILTRITPNLWGKAGSFSGFNVISWLKSSSNNNDFILFSSIGKYHLQSDSFIPFNYTNNICSISPNELYLLFNSFDVESLAHKYYLNEHYLNFDESYRFDLTSDPTWSCNSKYLILQINLDETNVPLEKQRYNEIWIIDVEELIQKKPSVVPIKKINIRKNFCMYSYGIWAHYLTDSTLAVSMFAPDGDFSYLYEISTDGKLLRQLTFNP